MKILDVIEAFSEAKVSGPPQLRSGPNQRSGSGQGSSLDEITGITFDSRSVKPGDLFVAVRGTAIDGHQFIEQAVKKGASVVVCETRPGEVYKNVIFIIVQDSRKALGIIASMFYGNPSRELKIVGVTGTNGKTTIATLLYKIHLALGYRAGLLSTIEVLINDKHYTATHTTPDPVQLHHYLRQMADAGCEFCFMEVSSHAISQNRIAGIRFAGGIFTNLTHEHLDYHVDFNSYLKAKKAFFDQLDEGAFALINRDDRHGQIMLQNSAASKYTYSLRSMADFRGKIIEMLLNGTNMIVNGQDVWIRLPGKFNAANILAVYGASVLSGHSDREVLKAISGMNPVRGRFETLAGRDRMTAVIDYAHTPDALLNVLQTISEVNRQGARVITVVGAGGNRDTAKRPKMAVIAVNYSDRVIFTSDNPRNEDPDSIIEQMIEGLSEDQRTNILKISNREEAIKTACMLAGTGDIVLVAGKGHETYQEIRGERFPFDDIEIVRRYIK